MSRAWMRALAAVVVIALLLWVGVAIYLDSTDEVAQGPGDASTTTIKGWQLRDSEGLSDPGETISQPGYGAAGWLPVGPRSTVLAGLVANGRYPDVFVSEHLSEVDTKQFQRPWWYRTTFTLERVDLRTMLRLAGVIPNGDAWLNGRQIATPSLLASVHNAIELDVTDLVAKGDNALAVKVHPADPARDFATVWSDWNPAPPDNNMGIWQDATVRQTGPVALDGPRVTTALALPGLGHADVTVKVDAQNTTNAAVTATVAGRIDDITWNSSVTLGPKERRTLTVDPSNTPALRIDRPKVWWPTGLGEHPTYRLTLSATVDGRVSDEAGTTFGVRDVRSTLDSSGYRVFAVNGRQLLIRSGGWAPDLFMRTDVARLERQLDVVQDLGLNAIRLEGTLETDEFYDLADQRGIMLLPGWTCCGKWEGYVEDSPFGQPWSTTDGELAEASMTAVAKRIRNHPSVIAFLIGSDHAPPADIETRYLRALKAADWPVPVIPSASAVRSTQLGSSGMKMDGPYDWVPPNYWYGDRLGAAFGFASELSAGPNVPRLDSLQKMLSAEEIEQLWRNPSAHQFHAGSLEFHAGSLPALFSSLGNYNAALFRRYGEPTSTAEYLRATQLANYENLRAQFEAYSARMDRPGNAATGLVHWMLNNSWPSLIWHLYDWYLAPDAGTYAVKKANAPLHVLWQYDTGEVTLVNHQATDAKGLSVSAAVYTLDGTRHFNNTVSGLSVASLRTAAALTVPDLDDVEGAYLLKLTLHDGAGKEIDRNVYWWSTPGDQTDWPAIQWFQTPLTSYADLSGLFDLPKVTLAASTTTAVRGGTSTVTVKLTHNGANAPAFFVEATLRGAVRQLVAPVEWSDNAVTLWPGETLTLTATVRSDAPLQVDIAGINVPPTPVPPA